MVETVIPFRLCSDELEISSLVVRLDPNMNIVARVLDLLIVLDVAMPELSLVTAQGETEIRVSELMIEPASYNVLVRRIEQMAGVRAVEAGKR